jgi:hypothetical protein
MAAGRDISRCRRGSGTAQSTTMQRIYVHQFDAARRSEGRRNRLAALETTA